ncbi:MAG: hypothetical protein V1761_01365, partial [bacterium]
MKTGDIIKKCIVAQGSVEIKLETVRPIARLSGVKTKDVQYFVDHLPSGINADGVAYANRITLTAETAGEVSVILGMGYLVVRDDVWCARFHHKQGWSGGDGIYSFNLTDGIDRFDQKPGATNMFCFGDSFVGRTDPITKQRYEPLLMPNNSIGIVEPGSDHVAFEVNQTEKGSVCSFVKVDPKMDVKGTIPQNLCTYDQKTPDPGWISGFFPKKVWITFDLQTPEPVDRIDIYNYFNEQSLQLSSRGIRIFRLLASNDAKQWNDLGEYELPKSRGKDDHTSITVGQTYRHFQFDVHSGQGIGNHEDEIHEGVFALSRVAFIHADIPYRDVAVDASSILLENPAQSYVWLQDGAVIGKNLYLFPYQVVSDHTQPEGMQFGILGISMIKIPIENNRAQFRKAIQKRTPWFYSHGGSDFAFGGGVTANSAQAGAEHPDGYVYVYGYKTTWVLRQLVAARVKENEFELFDKWEFFDGVAWTRDAT